MINENWVELGQVMDVARGGSPRPIKAFLTNLEDGVNWIKISDAQPYSKYIESTNQKIKQEGLKKTRFVHKGDFLLSNSMSFGRPYILKINGAIHDGWLVLSNKQVKYLNKDFLFYVLSSPVVFTQFHQMAKGSTVSNLNTNIVEKVRIPLVSFPEQRTIVAKIEELFSNLDNGIANLKKAKDKLEIYRQAVLKKAFEGELTREWREKQTNLPSADILLQEIKEERQRYYEKQIQEWEKSVKKWEVHGKNERKPVKPKAVKSLPSFMAKELVTLNKLPDEWDWVKVDKIQGHDQYSMKAGPFGSSLKKSCYVEDGYKIYGQEQVIAGDWGIGNYYIDQDKYEELKSCSVQPKDVLISLVGTVGKVLILPDDIEPGIINPRLIRISLASNFYSPKFFKYYFESAYLKGLYATKSHGATMDIINLAIIKEIPFPLLSITEQYQIIAEIETRLSVCDHIQANIDESLEKSESLRQSILKKAFEGRLLNDEELEACRIDPDWEPADKLLKRIQQERNEEDSNE